jgi:hypothetical protein
MLSMRRGRRNGGLLGGFSEGRLGEGGWGWGWAYCLHLLDALEQSL